MANYPLLWERFLSVVKYTLAVIMLIAGVLTMFSPTTPLSGDLGFLFAHRTTLVAFGAFFITSGATLLWGKIRRSRKLTGLGLMLIYLSFVFSLMMNGFALGWATAAWLPNFIGSMIVGALYLRWRFKTGYVDPKHFATDIDGLGKHSPPSRRFRR